MVLAEGNESLSAEPPQLAAIPTDNSVVRPTRPEMIPMALVTWSDDYSVGVKAIDAQHMKLFDILNELHGAMKGGQGPAVTGALLEKLVKYTKEHFANEERFMQIAGYPGLAEHHGHHEALTSQVGDFIARYKKGEGAINVDLLSFLRDWLKNHIQREDKSYSSCLIEHGIK